MLFSTAALLCAFVGVHTVSVVALPSVSREASLDARAGEDVLKPKVFILSTFHDEAESWRGIPDFDVFAQTINVPGLCPLFPDAHCTANGDVCQLTTGEGEINAAISISSLLSSSRFDLRETYFLVAGIASINPKIATIGSVTFAQYVIQFGLQHELDAREMPGNFASGYISFGSKASGEYPYFVFGTEVFELNDALRSMVLGFARRGFLSDSDDAMVYRSHYQSNNNVYLAGASQPGVVGCDVLTSDTWYSGAKLAEAAEEHTKIITKQAGTYCAAAQEDGAIVAALLRGAAAKTVDFGRVIIMRTGSDFDRPYWGQEATQNLFAPETGGHGPALKNLYLAGSKVVNGIVGEWTRTFEKGVQPNNYIGDILGTLGGTPDFRPAGLRVQPSTAGTGGMMGKDQGE